MGLGLKNPYKVRRVFLIQVDQCLNIEFFLNLKTGSCRGPLDGSKDGVVFPCSPKGSPAIGLQNLKIELLFSKLLGNP